MQSHPNLVVASRGHGPALGPPPTPDSLVNKARPRLLHAFRTPQRTQRNASGFARTAVASGA
eukprot:2838104-Prymnesium_polylepis.1